MKAISIKSDVGQLLIFTRPHHFKYTWVERQTDIIYIDVSMWMLAL